MPSTDDLIRKALHDKAATVTQSMLRWTEIPQGSLPMHKRRRNVDARRSTLLAVVAVVIVVVAVAFGSYGLATGGDRSHPAAGHRAATPDTSPTGRVSYVCALANDAHAHGDIDGWDRSLGAKAGPGMRDVVAIPGLLGAQLGAAPHGYEELRKPGQMMFAAISRGDTAKLQRSLNTIVKWCDENNPQDG